MEKEIRKIHKNGEENVTTIFNRIKFTDSIFLVSPLSNLFDRLAKGIHIIKCKEGVDNKKYETHRITFFTNYVAYAKLKDDIIECINVCVSRSIIKKFWWKF